MDERTHFAKCTHQIWPSDFYIVFENCTLLNDNFKEINILHWKIKINLQSLNSSERKNDRKV